MADEGGIEMADVKLQANEKIVEVSKSNSIDDEIGTNGSKFGNTRYDEKDMNRMGRRQELVRNYRPLSALSFTVILQATWEFLLMSNTQGLTDGGPAGLFWTYIWTFFGFGIVMISLAEMASMSPISGGQYQWYDAFEYCFRLSCSSGVGCPSLLLLNIKNS